MQRAAIKSGEENKRPRRGVPIEEALKRWSDPDAFAAMMEYSDAIEDRGVPFGQPPNEYVLRHREYERRRKALEEEQRRKLNEGELGASAIREYGECREALRPSLFDVVWIDYEFNQIAGENWKFVSPEIFDPSAIPTNIDDLTWLQPNAEPDTDEEPIAEAGFWADRDYRHVFMGRYGYRLGDIQAAIVRNLHEAARAGDPWRNGKELLAQAGSASARLNDLFKSQPNWQQLIESDRRGLYRLNLGGGASPFDPTEQNSA